VRGVGVRGTSIADRKRDLERLIAIAQATHVDRGHGFERITSRGDKCVYVMPLFAHQPVRVPHAHINRAATITHHEWATYEQEVTVNGLVQGR
jgi:hypothetical protein